MSAAVRRVRFGCSLQLPTVRVHTRELESLQPGSVLQLRLPANAMPELRVAGQPLHAALAIRQGPLRAAKVGQEIAEELR